MHPYEYYCTLLNGFNSVLSSKYFNALIFIINNYILLILVVHQSAAIASSTIGIAWAMASYHKNVRIAFENRKNIGNTGTVLQFLWHIMITGIFLINFRFKKYIIKITLRLVLNLYSNPNDLKH